MLCELSASSSWLTLEEKKYWALLGRGTPTFKESGSHCGGDAGSYPHRASLTVNLFKNHTPKSTERDLCSCSEAGQLKCISRWQAFWVNYTQGSSVL